MMGLTLRNISHVAEEFVKLKNYCKLMEENIVPELLPESNKKYKEKVIIKNPQPYRMNGCPAR